MLKLIVLTLILPGFSLHNKDWAEEVKKNIQSSEVIYWPHWEGADLDPDWTKLEAEKIITKIGDKKINIIAKSIGTVVAVNLIILIPNQINKIIFNGIPLTDVSNKYEEDYDILSSVSENNFVCFQNENDPLGSFENAKAFLGNINSNLKIISKLRDDHEYPYFDDFVEFLK